MKSKEQLFDDYFKKDSLAQEIRYDIERVISYAQEDAVKTFREMKYVIIGFEFDEPLNYGEFFQIIKNGKLYTTDDWNYVKKYDSLFEVQTELSMLKKQFPDYGWYIVLV